MSALALCMLSEETSSRRIIDRGTMPDWMREKTIFASLLFADAWEFFPFHRDGAPAFAMRVALLREQNKFPLSFVSASIQTFGAPHGVLQNLNSDAGWIDLPEEAIVAVINALGYATGYPTRCSHAVTHEGGIITAARADDLTHGGLRPAGEVCNFDATIWMEIDNLSNLSNHEIMALASARRGTGTAWIEYFNPAAV
ncbi:hypothetical protein ACOI1H_16360 [Loktanella sp. DJP18]|uniref:hypothetical protein n=1 Tax=Loktanella sp. DJP18 TaxID=3409788 RepID=UPI003BB6209A